MSALCGDELDADPGLQRVAAQISRLYAEMEAERVGYARQTLWTCEDGWIAGYTTERITGGPFDGKFAVMAYKPTGRGARGGRKTAQQWERVYYRSFATRKAAKKRAEDLYWKHCPKRAARVGR